jgi:proline iminopeptidase
VAAALHADTPPLRTLWLPVAGGHRLQVQEFGCDDGIPAVVLHGGPGSGCSPLLRRVFDPARYRVICVDQRGAGASTPRGATVHNTTFDLLADLCRLREHLGLARWLVAGGSWGSALAVAYAATEPHAVTALLLRASFLARRADIDAFFEGSGIDLAQAERALSDGDERRQAAVARAWWAWEQQLATGQSATLGDALLSQQIDRYRVQAHYLVNGCWLQSPSLLERCEAVPRVPTLLLHGDDDRICPPAGAIALQERLPAARLQWVPGAGHDPAHPAMIAATVSALDRYASHGDFDGAPA